jgi:hypothetical protein
MLALCGKDASGKRHIESNAVLLILSGAIAMISLNRAAARHHGIDTDLRNPLR